MQFTVDKDAMQSALSFVRGAVSNKAPSPLMEMVRMEAKDGQVFLRGTNLALDIEAWVDAQVKMPGAICVNKLCTDFITGYKSGEIEFELKKMLIARQGKTTDKFAIALADGFPEKPQCQNFVELDVSKFVKVLEVCSVGLSNRTDLPATKGYYINPDLNLVMTSDGDRIIYYPMDMRGEDIVIPAGNYLNVLLPKFKSSEKVEVSFTSGNWVGFRGSNWTAYVNQIQGRFPDLVPIVERVKVEQPSLTLNVSVSEISRILAKAVRLSDEALNVGRLHHMAIDRDNSEVSFQMNAQDIGEIHNVLEDVEAEGVERFRILVHPRILKEIIDVIPDKVVFQFYKPTSPFIVRDPNEEYTYIQVAMKLDSEAAKAAEQQEVVVKEEEPGIAVETEEDTLEPVLAEADSDF